MSSNQFRTVYLQVLFFPKRGAAPDQPLLVRTTTDARADTFVESCANLANVATHQLVLCQMSGSTLLREQPVVSWVWGQVVGWNVFTAAVSGCNGETRIIRWQVFAPCVVMGWWCGYIVAVVCELQLLCNLHTCLAFAKQRKSIPP